MVTLTPNQNSSEDHWRTVWLGSSVLSLTFLEDAVWNGRVCLSFPPEESQFWGWLGYQRERSKTLLWRRRKKSWFRSPTSFECPSPWAAVFWTILSSSLVSLWNFSHVFFPFGIRLKSRSVLQYVIVDQLCWYWGDLAANSSLTWTFNFCALKQLLQSREQSLTKVFLINWSKQFTTADGTWQIALDPPQLKKKIFLNFSTFENV